MMTMKGTFLLLSFTSMIFSATAAGGGLNLMGQLDKGLKTVDPTLLDTVNTAVPGLMDQIKNTTQCLQNKLKGLDLCNFKAPIDPVYYIKECMKGTPLEALIQSAVGPLNQPQVMMGIPQNVSDQRCFDPLAALGLDGLSNALGNLTGGLGAVGGLAGGLTGGLGAGGGLTSGLGGATGPAKAAPAVPAPVGGLAG